MCGIIGYSGRASVASLTAGLRLIAHRGPDDSGIFVDEAACVALGHVRLAILDLSPFGHQPMHSTEAPVALVFNGEIYNFRELRKELEALGVAFHGHSDTEVLLNLYLHEGATMLTRLNGIFAFAIWDGRSRTVLLARDALGVKPLYYATTSIGVAFASEMKGLLALIPDFRELDIVALHRYLTFLWCPGEGTPLKSIRKLLPGEAMILRDGAIERLWKWYTLPIARGVAADVGMQAAVDGTLSHLRQAVHRQMVSDVPLGAFLSGGIDSSAVVALAREVNPNLQCFTIEATGGQEEGFVDDLPYARNVAKHLGVSLEVVQIDPGRMASDLETMVAQLDEPLADPAPLNVLYISRLARKHGMKVLLSGAGGDDLFTGYRRHRAVQFDAYLNWLPRRLRSAVETLTSRLDQRRAWARRTARLFNGFGLTGDERVANYFVWVREGELLALYTPEFRAQLGASRAAEPMLNFLALLPGSATPLDRMLALEQRFFLGDHNLIYTDKMSMAAGVETRVPFLDLELVEFAARVPVNLKQRGSVGKWALKKAMEPYLPHEVIYRPKTGFGAPLRRWMQRELRPLLGDLLSTESLKTRGLFDAKAVQALIAANDKGRVDASYTLLSLLCIEIWCRSFVANASGRLG